MSSGVPEATTAYAAGADATTFGAAAAWTGSRVRRALIPCAGAPDATPASVAQDGTAFVPAEGLTGSDRSSGGSHR